jgi:U5 small nuclear ribonucleoprotein component
MYSDTFGTFDIDEFAMRLWGNIYYDSEKRKFTRKSADMDAKRSFVHFILEPLYKLYTQVCPTCLCPMFGKIADGSRC